MNFKPEQSWFESHKTLVKSSNTFSTVSMPVLSSDWSTLTICFFLPHFIAVNSLGNTMGLCGISEATLTVFYQK